MDTGKFNKGSLGPILFVQYWSSIYRHECATTHILVNLCISHHSRPFQIQTFSNSMKFASPVNERYVIWNIRPFRTNRNFVCVCVCVASTLNGISNPAASPCWYTYITEKFQLNLTLLSFCHEHVPRLSMILHVSNASSPGLTSVYLGWSANRCRPFDTITRWMKENGKGKTTIKIKQRTSGKVLLIYRLFGNIDIILACEHFYGNDDKIPRCEVSSEICWKSQVLTEVW